MYSGMTIQLRIQWTWCMCLEAAWRSLILPPVQSGKHQHIYWMQTNSHVCHRALPLTRHRTTIRCAVYSVSMHNMQLSRPLAPMSTMLTLHFDLATKHWKRWRTATKMNSRIHITVMKLAPGRERWLHTHTGQLDHDELIMPCMESVWQFATFRFDEIELNLYHSRFFFF